MKQEELIQILINNLTGAASDEEKTLLESWLNESDQHREMFMRLNDRKSLKDEYDRQECIGTDRPMRDMNSRITVKRRRLPYYLSAISGAAAAIALFALFFREAPASQASSPEPVDYMASIVPGQTKATLTNPAGDTFELVSEEIPAPKPIKMIAPQAAQEEESVVPVIAMNSLAVPRGGEFHIILEDSTEVWLNAESSLEYPESFGVDERKVEVTGEAYFKVHKEQNRPFLVKTADQVVRVYGTEFSVSSYPEDDFVYTTLVEGRIGILPSEGSTSSLFLSPDNQAVFSKADATTVVNPVNAKLVTSWKDGMFVFEDQTLAQIMVQLSRWYDFEYRFADEASAAIQFKGRIPRYGKFSDMLEILEKSGGIRFTAENERIVISKR